jgi:hypothetical protein
VADWLPEAVEHQEQQAVGNIQKLAAKPGCSALIGDRKLARVGERVLTAPSREQRDEGSVAGVQLAHRRKVATAKR